MFHLGLPQFNCSIDWWQWRERYIGCSMYPCGQRHVWAGVSSILAGYALLLASGATSTSISRWSHSNLPFFYPRNPGAKPQDVLWHRLKLRSPDRSSYSEVTLLWAWSRPASHVSPESELRNFRFGCFTGSQGVISHAWAVLHLEHLKELYLSAPHRRTLSTSYKARKLQKDTIKSNLDVRDKAVSWFTERAP